MKRREFLTGLAGAAGCFATGLSRADNVAPCPPILGEPKPCGPGSAPAWFASMQDRTWATPVVNSLDSVKPNPLPAGNTGFRSLTDAWTGGCVDQERGEFILAANGGHLDYSGNEVYACSMKSDSPSWVRLNEPSAPVGGTQGTNTRGDYGDGAMRSVHGYNRCVFGAGRIWYAGMDGMYSGNGYWSTACWSFDRDTLKWTYYGLGIPDTGGGNYNGEQGVACYDRVHNRVLAMGAGANGAGVGTYSVSHDGSISQIATPGFARWGAVAHDLRLWIVGDTFNGRIGIFDLDNLIDGPAFVYPSGTFPNDRFGCVYHQASRALLLWNGQGANIVKIGIPNDPYSEAWSITSVGPAGSNSVVPSAPPAQGTFSRFNIIEDMGNGQSALVLVNSVAGPVFVYKLPAAGV